MTAPKHPVRRGYPWRELAIRVMVVVQCDANLVQIILALDSPSRLARGLHGRQQ
jgi:hypothetical protein